MESCRRPNRSDAHLSPEEETKVEEQTRDYFDGIAPHRHTKPQRSEYSTKYVDAVAAGDNDGDSMPEYAEFQRLEHDPQEKKLDYNGSKVEDEFVETEYYQDLNCIEKQHHTTGTGFIKVDDSKATSFHLEPDQETEIHASSHGNPATNDWIPSAADPVAVASDKPKTSDI